MTMPPVIPAPVVPTAIPGLADLGDGFEGDGSSPDTDLNEIEPGVPAEPVAEKRGVRAASKVTAIDWTKVTPRKEDDFDTQVGAQKLSETLQKIRDFINAARDQNLYGLFYPILEFDNRNACAANVTKVNNWRKGTTNKYGVRDGENIAAKSEKQGDKFILWVGLLKDEAALLPEGIKPEAG